MKQLVFGKFFSVIIIFSKSVIGAHESDDYQDIDPSKEKPAFGFCKLKNNSIDSYQIRRICFKYINKIENIKYRTIQSEKSSNPNENNTTTQSLKLIEYIYFYDKSSKRAIPITELKEEVKIEIFECFDYYITHGMDGCEENIKFVKIVENYIDLLESGYPSPDYRKGFKRSCRDGNKEDKNTPRIEDSESDEIIVIEDTDQSFNGDGNEEDINTPRIENSEPVEIIEVEKIDQSVHEKPNDKVEKAPDTDFLVPKILTKIYNRDKSDKLTFFSESGFKNVSTEDRLLTELEITNSIKEFSKIFKECKKKISGLNIQNDSFKNDPLGCCEFFLYELNHRFDGFEHKMKMNLIIYTGLMNIFNHFNKNSLFSLLLPEFILFEYKNSKKFFKCDEQDDVKLKDIFMLELTMFFLYELFLGKNPLSSIYKNINNLNFFFEIRARLRLKITELTNFVWKEEFLAIYIKLTIKELSFHRSVHGYKLQDEQTRFSETLKYKNRNLHSCLMRLFFKIQSDYFSIKKLENQPCNESENQKTFNIQDYMTSENNNNINEHQPQIINTHEDLKTCSTLANKKTNAKKNIRKMKIFKEETSKSLKKYKYFVANLGKKEKQKNFCKNTMEKIIGSFFFHYLSHDKFNIGKLFEFENRKIEFLRFVENLIIDYREIKPDVFKNLFICFDEKDLKKKKQNSSKKDHTFGNRPCKSTTFYLFREHNGIDKNFQFKNHNGESEIIVTLKKLENEGEKSDNKDEKCEVKECFIYQCFNMIKFIEINDFNKFEELIEKERLKDKQ